MARIARMHGIGGPEVLRIDDIEVGEPGDHEVRIRVGAVGLNRHETMVFRGEYGQIPLPARIGYEAAGIVDATGSGVVDFRAGDRVAILPGVSMEEHGTCGEVILCPADMLVAVPAAQSDVDAAATWMQFLTAYAVRAFRPLNPGDPVVITAASSSVGLAAIQLVNLAGGIPIAVTRGSAKRAALMGHGAAHVIVSDEEDVSARTSEITGGEGVALVFDPIGGPGFPALLATLRRSGLAILYGALGGEPTTFSAPYMAYSNLAVQGYAANNLVADRPRRDEAVAHISKGLAEGSLRPIVDRTFPLSEIVEAYRYLESNQQVGKVVVTTASSSLGDPA